MRKLTTTVAIALILSMAAVAVGGGELPAIRAVPVKPEPTLGHKILWYVPNRVCDLIDTVRVNVGYGPGFGANVHIADVAEVGAANYESQGAALQKRKLQSYEANVQEGGAKLISMQKGTLMQRDPSEVGVEAHALVGAGAGVSLSEVVDFGVGFITADPSGDDY